MFRRVLFRSGYDYAAGAAILKSTLSFDAFIEAMSSGTVVLNIHTDKFGNGEISGKVSQLTQVTPTQAAPTKIKPGQ